VRAATTSSPSMTPNTTISRAIQDEDVFAAAIAEERALVTENVPDFGRLEADALARGEAHAASSSLPTESSRAGSPARSGTSWRRSTNC
jgi:Domain of unknown function (DUF5615)